MSRTAAWLLTGWLIISASYVAVHAVFVVFGFYSKAALGSFLVIVPCLFGMLYFGKSRKHTDTWLYVFGILFPTVIEKVVLYLLGAFLYDISPTKFSSVLLAVSGHEPYVNFFTNPNARYYLNISFFGRTYIFFSLAAAAIMVLLLVKNRSRKIT